MKKNIGRILLIVAAVLLFIVLVGPFLIPVPPLEDTVPPEQLVYPDSEFVEVDNLNVHYRSSGSGQPVFLLLHGFGASTFSWREVMAPFGEMGTAIAYDRPAFGLTERPLPGDWEKGQNPYTLEAQAELALHLLEELGYGEGILVGNSAGGTVAVQAALISPEQVRALILVDAAIYSGGPPSIVAPLLNTPQMDRLGPLLVRSIRTWGEDFLDSAWHDPSLITVEVREGYRRPLRAQDWDRALWELTQARDQVNLPTRLDEVQLPVLVITGDDDRIVPTEDSIRLATELPNADLAVLEACGHVPQEECPAAFMEAVQSFVEELE